MRVVIIKKEIEYSKLAPVGDTGKMTERCMGIFPSVKAATREVALYLFDELNYHASENNGNVNVGCFTSWKHSKDNDMSTLELSMGNMEYVFKAYYVDDEEDEDAVSEE